VVQIWAGLLQLGGQTRFVSHSVMVGFLTGIAVSIIRDLPRCTGKVDLSDAVKIDLATSVIGESRRRADDDATAWPLEPHAVRQPNAVREPDDA
jgi:hypothetical protein